MYFKSFIILMLLTVVSSSLFANSDSTKFKMGIHFGMNGSTFSDKIGEFAGTPFNSYQKNARIGGVIGLKSQIRLNKIISIQPELNYHSRGGSYKQKNNSVFYMGIGNSEDEDAYNYKNYRLSYIEMPLLISFNILGLLVKSPVMFNSKMNIGAGVVPAYNVGSSLRYNGFEVESPGAFMSKVDETYNTKSFDYAKDFLLSYVFELSIEMDIFYDYTTFANLRFSRSIGGVYDVSELNYMFGTYNMKTEMSTVSLGCGIMF